MKRSFAAQFGERLKFLSPQQATGYFRIFTTAHRAVMPHFRFKKDLILYLNSSRAASSGEFKFKIKELKMKATVFQAPWDVRVEEVPDPAIKEPTDAIVRVTNA
ncbi:MAG TPA: hypothetical protein VLM43_15655, partial [Desulfobacterales bacterium]|nr:hypothetical protein [Desulfobacterales bacterium]